MKAYLRILLGVVLLLAANCRMASCGPPPPAPGTDRVTMPPGWPTSPNNRIPSAVELGKYQGDLTDSEVSFLASHESIVALQLFGKRYPYIEDGVKANTARIKKLNPKTSVLHYWGFRGTGHTNYRAYMDPHFNKAWYVQKPGAKKAGLRSEQPRLPGMVAMSAAKMTADVGTDGIYIDGANNTANDPEAAHKLDLFARLRAVLELLGQGHKLIIVNGPGATALRSRLDLPLRRRVHD